MAHHLQAKRLKLHAPTELLVQGIEPRVELASGALPVGRTGIEGVGVAVVKLGQLPDFMGVNQALCSARNSSAAQRRSSMWS